MWEIAESYHCVQAYPWQSSHATLKRSASDNVAWEEKQEEQPFSLEWSSFYFLQPKEAESTWICKTIDPGIMYTWEKIQNHYEFRASVPSACCCAGMWQKWIIKGVLLQQGARPAVCAEAKAFEAPHEKCQNT